MALAVPTISVQDGSAAAAANVAANATAFVTPGNAVTFALQSSTGVQSARFVWTNTGTVLDGTSSPVLTSTPFSWTVTLPVAPFTGILTTEVTDGQNVTTNNNFIVSGAASSFRSGGGVHRARNVILTSVASLAAYTVAAGAQNDNVSGGNVQGDFVLLVAQGSAANGLYVVGLPSAGTAPLTRAPDFATGTVMPASQTTEIAEGTIFALSTWKMTATGGNLSVPVTVDTTNHTWWPRQHNFTVAIGTPFTTGWFARSTGAQGSKVIINDQTSTTTGTKVVVVAGAGVGTATATGTGTDSIDAAVVNW